MQAAASALNLPPQLLGALKELDVLSKGVPDAEGFWQRLAEQLERLEELAPELPPGIAVEDLAAWLAAGPGGHVLPEGGNPLPGAGEGSPLASLAALTGEGGTGGLPELLREHLPPDITVEDLTAWLAAGNPLPALPGPGEASPLASLAALPGLGGPGGPPLREQLLAMAVHAVMDGTGRVPGGVSPGLTEGTERGLLELAALQARSARGLQLGQAPVVTSGTAEAALPQLQTTGGLALPRLLSLDVPLQQPGWDRSLGDRVQWMVNQNVQLAELKLNPPGLGPLEVRVRVDGDRTHISFLASQASVRDAVDAALPRLREMFAEGGVTLGDVTVGHRDGGDGGGGQGTLGKDGAGATDGKSDDAQADPLRPKGTRAGQGLVDYYA
jgi:flagellar hook-length control protein FliK